MVLFFKALVAILPFFILLDAAWILLIARGLYERGIGHLLAASVNWYAVGAFYLMYAAAIAFFAVLPASDSGGVWRAAYTGALLGAVSYATYELTNMATLSGWPVTLVVVDVLWGAFATGAAAALGYYTLRILGVVG